MSATSQLHSEVKELIQDCLAEGFWPPNQPSIGKSALDEAADRLMDNHPDLTKHVAGLYVKYISEHPKHKPDFSLYRAHRYQASQGGIYIPSEASVPQGDKLNVGIIGDAHDSPHLPDKTRFKQMGRWVRDNNFDYVVQIGDWATLDSLSTHAKPGTGSFGQLPSFVDDMQSLERSLKAFDAGLGKGWKGKKVFIKGNHENRAERYEEANPQVAGAIVSTIDGLFTKHGWRVVPFGEVWFLNGVGFIHHPINIMGKAYGGVTADQRASKDLTYSLFHGHDHRRSVTEAPKIGPVGSVQVVSVGCSLPYQYYEDYAKLGPSGWWWGVTSATLQQGQILSLNFTSMIDLQ